MKASRVTRTIAALLSLAPPSLWLLAQGIGQIVGCSVPLRSPAVCMYEYIDLNIFLGPVASWAMWLSLPGLVVAVALFGLTWLSRRTGAARDRAA